MNDVHIHIQTYARVFNRLYDFQGYKCEELVNRKKFSWERQIRQKGKHSLKVIILADLIDVDLLFEADLVIPLTSTTQAQGESTCSSASAIGRFFGT